MGRVLSVLLLFALQLVIIQYYTSYKGYILTMLKSLRLDKHRFVHINEEMKNEYYRSHYGSCQYSVVKERNINCQNLIENTTSVKAFRIRTDKTRLCNLTKISENCDFFRHINGYEDKSVSAEELNFPLAFGIRLHKSTQQVEQALRILYRPHNFYCLHVDTGSPRDVYESLKSVAKCFPNVVILSQIRTIYSSIKLVEADVLCMREALKASITWKYFLNMAGQELPIKTNLEIVQIAQSLRGRNDIASQAFQGDVFTRILYHHEMTNVRPRRTNIKKKPFELDIKFRKGAAYGMLSRQFVDFAVNDDVAKKLFDFLSDTEAPEETFISTLNFIPGVPGGSNRTITHKNKNFISRTVIWMWDGIECHGIYRRGVCTLQNSGLPWVFLQPEMILNKVDHAFDQVIIDCIEEYLGNKSRRYYLDK